MVLCTGRGADVGQGLERSIRRYAASARFRGEVGFDKSRQRTTRGLSTRLARAENGMQGLSVDAGGRLGVKPVP